MRLSWWRRAHGLVLDAGTSLPEPEHGRRVAAPTCLPRHLTPLLGRCRPS